MLASAIPTLVSELRVGDIVRLTGGNWSGHPEGGKEKAVIEVRPGEAVVEGRWYVYDNDVWPFVFVSRPGDPIVEAVTEHFGRPIEPTAPIVEVPAMTDMGEVDRLRQEVATLRSRVTELSSREFTRYNESMRPMFLNAARVANAAGYCAEYDRIASAVGAPTREEFGRELTRQARVRVPFQAYVYVDVETSEEEIDDERDFIETHIDDIREAIRDGAYDMDVDVHSGDLVSLEEWID